MSERATKARFRRVRTPTLLQMEATECGAASLGIILAYHGRHVPLDELRTECRVSRDGTSAIHIKQAAEKHGLTGKGYRIPVEDLSELRPPLIVFWELKHFLVVEGFGHDQVYLNDPASGRRAVSFDEFARLFAGIAFQFQPAPGFKKGGRKPSAWRSIVRRMAGASSAVILVVLAGVALMVAELVTATFGPLFVDQILVAERRQWVRPLLLAMGLTILFRLSIGLIQLNGLMRLKRSLAASQSARFVWHVLRLPTAFYQQRYAGDIAVRVDGNSAVADLVSGPLATTLIGLLLVVSYGAVMFVFDPLLAAVGVAVGLLNLAAIGLAQRILTDEGMKVKHFKNLLAGSMMHAVQIVETIKAGASENEALVHLTGNQARLTNASQRVTTITGLVVVVPPLLSLVTTAAVLRIGGGHVIDGLLSVGALVAFQALLSQFHQPFGELVSLGSSVQILQAELTRLDDVEQHRIDPVFDPKPSPERQTNDPTTRPRPRQLSGRLELRNVSFGFNRANQVPLIDRLSLTIEPGKRVALVGPSGSGKSTVGRLSAGLLTPWDGQILYDGFPIDEIPRDVFTDQVGMVDDQALLFSGTIRENLSFWDDAVTDREMTQAAIDAEIHGDIVRLRHGYSAKLSAGARNLSGGQRQRMEIGRTLIHNPSLLILDEATSALDPLTEARVDDNIRRRECTCLIIAHRLSTIRDCHEIIVLKHGKVIERGTHDELMSNAGGFYAELQNLQDGSHASTVDLPDQAWRPTSVSVSVSLNPSPAPAPGGDSSALNGHESQLPAISTADARLAEAIAADERRARARRRDAAMVSRALAGLYLPEAAELGRAGGTVSEPLALAESECLAAACRTVAEPQAIEVKAVQSAGVDDPLRMIARASGFRTRRIKLGPRWWHQEGVAMLGRRAVDGRPVALLPDSSRGYVVIDPMTGTRVRLTTEVARELQPHAFVFYRTLPASQTTLRSFFRFGLPAVQRELWTLAGLGLTCGLLGLVVPSVVAVAIDDAIPRANRRQLDVLCAFLIAVALSISAFQAIQTMALARLRAKLESILLPALWERLLSLPVRFFAGYDAGDLAVRAMGLVRLIESMTSTSVASMMLSIFALFNVVALLVLNWKLGLVAAALLAVFPLASLAAIRSVWRCQTAISETRGEIAGLLFLLLGGITRLRVAGAEPRAFARWAARYERQLGQSLRLQTIAGRLALLGEVWPTCVLMVVLAMATFGSTGLSLGEFVAFYTSLSIGVGAAVGLGNGAISLIDGLRECERFAPILAAMPEVTDVRGEPVHIAGAIQLENMSFRYAPESPYVLNRINLHVQPGEFIAIVGPTGSGKSTLLRLLLGFETPTEGTVSYDGRDLATLDVQEVRRQIGVVLQDARLRPGDVYSNIVGLSTQLTRDDAWEAAELAGLDQDIEAMPMGIHTVVTEGGSGLSSGQRQRLMIARALAGRPKILLFDEATSALDNRTQAHVSHSIHSRLRGTTRVAIAHRLSTVLDADRIYVMTNGTIVQSGTYTQLIAQPGPFQDLARRQMIAQAPIDGESRTTDI